MYILIYLYNKYRYLYNKYIGVINFAHSSCSGVPGIITQNTSLPRFFKPVNLYFINILTLYYIIMYNV